MLRWTIGDVTITCVVEMEPIMRFNDLFADATPAEIEKHSGWLRPYWMNDDGDLRLSIHAFVVDAGRTRIVVDTCVGNDKPRTYEGMDRMSTAFLDDLAVAGYPTDSIDTVLCTHLHFDHVGWNTRLADGRWVPTFPSSRYLFAAAEWEFWQEEERIGRETFDSHAVIADSVQPIVDAGLVDLVDVEHRLSDGVWLEPTPGHTPGHVSVRVSSKGQDAVITGDMVHHPVQIREPTWNGSADAHGPAAVDTRHRFFERYGDSDVLVLGTHFAAPTAGHVVRGSGGWDFRVD